MLLLSEASATTGRSSGPIVPASTAGIWGSVSATCRDDCLPSTVPSRQAYISTPVVRHHVTVLAPNGVGRCGQATPAEANRSATLRLEVFLLLLQMNTCREVLLLSIRKAGNMPHLPLGRERGSKCDQEIKSTPSASI